MSAPWIQGCLGLGCLNFPQFIKCDISDSVEIISLILLLIHEGGQYELQDGFPAFGQFHHNCYYFLWSKQLKKTKQNIVICMWTQQLDDISVSWRCIIPDIPALAFYSGSKRSHVICLHLGILPLYIICQDIIWNVNLFLQYTVSSESQSLLYIMHITVQVARKWCFFLFLQSGVSRVE